MSVLKRFVLLYVCVFGVLPALARAEYGLRSFAPKHGGEADLECFELEKNGTIKNKTWPDDPNLCKNEIVPVLKSAEGKVANRPTFHCGLQDHQGRGVGRYFTRQYSDDRHLGFCDPLMGAKKYEVLTVDGYKECHAVAPNGSVLLEPEHDLGKCGIKPDKYEWSTSEFSAACLAKDAQGVEYRPAVDGTRCQVTYKLKTLGGALSCSPVDPLGNFIVGADSADPKLCGVKLVSHSFSRFYDMFDDVLEDVCLPIDASEQSYWPEAPKSACKNPAPFQPEISIKREFELTPNLFVKKMDEATWKVESGTQKGATPRPAGSKPTVKAAQAKPLQ